MESAKASTRKGAGRPPGSSIPSSPLAGLTGSVAAEAVLLFLSINGSGYAAQIARVTNLAVTAVKAQLLRLEAAGFLERYDTGRVGVFKFARRPMAQGFAAWLDSLAQAMSLEERAVYGVRQKARSSGKKLRFEGCTPQEKT